MDLLFCGTGWLSHTSLHLITFYYLGYFEGCFPDFVLTEAKIAKQSCGFGEVTLKLTHPHIGRGGQGHVSRGGRVSVFMSLSLCECLCVYVSVFMGADVCFCAFTVCTHPHIGRGGQGHIARGERVSVVMSLSLCECLCVYVSVFVVVCSFSLTLTLAEEGRDT